MPTASISSMKTMHWPPHLRASRLALRASSRTVIASMPDEHAGEARAGDRHERAVEVGGDGLGQHRLAGAGGAQHQQAALALAAGLLERLAGLPQRDDAAHLLLGLRLAAHVVQLHAPVGVARLVGADLADGHHQERAEEDAEVDEEEQRQLQEQDQGLGPERARCPPGSEDRLGDAVEEPSDDADHDDPDGEPVPEPRRTRPGAGPSRPPAAARCPRRTGSARG